MADDTVISSDELLLKELQAFGENVDKVTDKNRLILEKKLNHLRARRRMSEKLSQSFSSPKSPVKSSRGRGKKNVKRANITQLQDSGTDPEPVEISPPQSKVKKTEEHNAVNDSIAPLSTITVQVPLTSSVTASKRGRKSAMPSTAVSRLEEAVPKVVEKDVGNGSGVYEGPSTVKTANGAGGVNRRGRKTILLDQAIDVVPQRSPTVEVESSKEATNRRRTYSCEKVVSNTESANNDSVASSRIPKYAQVKPAVGLSRGAAAISAHTEQEAAESKHEESPLVSVQIIDSLFGKAAANVASHLERQTSTSWITVAKGSTDENGCCDFPASGCGIYRLHVETEAYFQHHCRPSFYPFIDTVFKVENESVSRINMQLTLSQFAYSISVLM